MSSETIGFLVFASIGWYLIAPAASAQLALIFTQERITESIRGYIEFKWPGSLLDYLVHCPVCMSHWTAAFVCILGTPLWIKIAQYIPIMGGSYVLEYLVWLATVYYTVQKVK